MSRFNHQAWLESYESALLARLEAEQGVDVSPAQRWEQRPSISLADVDDIAFEVRHTFRAVPRRNMARSAA